MTVTAEEARAALSARLGPGAFAHSVAVAETASGLAAAYGVDPAESYLGGLLHDWAREMAADRLLAEAEALDIVITDVDRAVPYLLHARVGARTVRDTLPGLSERVTTAIERHTTGSPDMSDLDMVVYLADMLEPGRDFEGVEALRDQVGQLGLSELYAHAYTASLLHLLKRRKHLHPETLAAWNAVVESREHR